MRDSKFLSNGASLCRADNVILQLENATQQYGSTECKGNVCANAYNSRLSFPCRLATVASRPLQNSPAILLKSRPRLPVPAIYLRYLVCGVIQNLCRLGSGGMAARMKLRRRAQHLAVLVVGLPFARDHTADSTALRPTARKSIDLTNGTLTELRTISQSLSAEL
jgi:hypothetical protein